MDQEKWNELEPERMPELTTGEPEPAPVYDQELDDLLGPELLEMLGVHRPEPETELLMPEIVAADPIADISEPEVPEAPAEAPEAVPVREPGEYVFPVRRRPRKDPRKGTKIFYSIYASTVIILIAALFAVTIPLHNWLVNYEASQPKQQCQAVFDTVFAQPDWSVIYDLAEVRSTAFESKDAYVTYMSAKVSAAKNPDLTFAETSAGLSGDRKYIVKLDNEKIATFTLESSTDGAATTWKLGVVEVFFERAEIVTVEKLPEHTVYINGVPLDNSYTVRKIETVAEGYLPEGIHGYRMEQQFVDGLLTKPTVDVVDAEGKDVPVVYDEATKTYKLQVEAPAEMTDAEREIALKAAEANTLFAIRAISTGELRKYFDANSQIYKDIIDTPMFIQSFTKYEFDDSVTAVTDFCRYNDKLFSARVTMTLNVTRKNGTVKPLETNTTYFFTKTGTGNYLVTNITNVSIQEQVEQVLLRFEESGQQIATVFVATNAETVTVPTVIAPEGQVFRGWAMQSTDEKGNLTMTILFAPDESGLCAVPEDVALEPMTLYAVFEQEGANAQ